MRNVTPSSRCIYRLPGLVLYCEEVGVGGDCLVFDMDRTAVIAMVAGPSGLGIQAFKGSESPHALYGGKLTVRRDSVWGTQDTVNPDLVTLARQAISGIILPTGPHR